MRTVHYGVLVGLILLVLVCGLLAGCVSLTPDQRADLENWKAFAHRVTQHYGVADVTFLVGPHGGSEHGTMRPGGILTLRPDRIGPDYDFLLAHELGHWVRGHAKTYRCFVPRERDEGVPGSSCGTVDAMELAANAEAIQILMLGRGISEEEAFRRAVQYLYIWHGAAVGCREIKDLLRRYPAYPAYGGPGTPC